MDYDLSPGQAEKLAAFGTFCGEEIFPRARDLARGEGDAMEILRACLRGLGGVGYLGLCRSSEGGGGDEELVLQAAMGEILAKTSRTVYLSAFTSGVHAGHLVDRFGTEEQGGAFLKGLTDGAVVASVARTEARSGVDLATMSTCARPDGKGFLLEGEKSFCLNGPMADLFVVFASVDAEGDLGCFLVPRQTEGLEVHDPFETLGYAGLPLGALRLRGARLGKDHLLGGPREGRAVLEESLRWDALGMTSASVGIIEGSLEASFAHSQERVVFGKPIGSYQEISFKVAEIRAMLDTARLLSQKAAWLMQSGDPGAPTMVSCAKLYASEAAVKSAGYALQILAGEGVRKGSVVEQLFRDAKMSEIGGGTSESHRLRIAKDVLEAF